MIHIQKQLILSPQKRTIPINLITTTQQLKISYKMSDAMTNEVKTTTKTQTITC